MSCYHGENSCAASDSAPLSFRTKPGVDPVSRGTYSNLVNNLVGDLDPGSSPEGQKEYFFGEPYLINNLHF